MAVGPRDEVRLAPVDQSRQRLQRVGGLLGQSMAFGEQTDLSPDVLLNQF
jgi:hypothetical protein